MQAVFVYSKKHCWDFDAFYKMPQSDVKAWIASHEYSAQIVEVIVLFWTQCLIPQLHRTMAYRAGQTGLRSDELGQKYVHACRQAGRR